MAKFVILAVLGVIVWKMFIGRWPWEQKLSARAQAVSRARNLLGVSAGASHEEIVIAHKKLVTLVHPDRGGSNDQMHEATAARDTLLEELPRPLK